MGESLLVPNQTLGFFGYGLENTFEQGTVFAKPSPTTISARFTAPVDWIGWGDILHGGFQGLLLDEITCRVAGELASALVFVSRDFSLRYRRPVYVDKPLCILGHLLEDRTREIVIRGEIQDTEGNLLTEAHNILSRIELDSTRAEKEGCAPVSGAQSESRSLTHWPAWEACCAGPLERLWNLHIDWHMAPDQSALGGFLHLPPALHRISPTGVLAALFDQAFGLLGRAQGHGVMLTVRLQVTAHCALPVEEELVLFGHGYRWLDGPFKAQAQLQHKGSLVAEASGHFKILT